MILLLANCEFESQGRLWRDFFLRWHDTDIGIFKKTLSLPSNDYSFIGGKMFILIKILTRIIEISVLLLFTYFIMYSSIKK